MTEDCVKIRDLPHQALEKRATTPIGRQLLANEAQALQVMEGLNVPEVLAFETSIQKARLRRSFIPGQPLDALSLVQQSKAIPQLVELLRAVHDRGLIHGDLKPSNVIVAPAGSVYLIDWEHSLPLGASLELLPLRGCSLGMTHPDLIWGRGVVRTEHDLHAIERMSSAAEGPAPTVSSIPPEERNTPTC